MKHGSHVWLLLTLLAIPAAGCRLADTFKIERVSKPEVQVDSVKVVDQTDQGARIEITVTLTNTADAALPLVDANYTVSVDGQEPVTFENRPNRTIPVGGTQTVVLPLVIAISGDGPLAGRSVAATGSLIYEPPGEIRELMTESNIPLPSASFRYRGVLE